MVTGRHRRVLPAQALLVAIALAAFPTFAAASPEDDLAAAQSRANRVAEELSRAEEELARSDDAVASVQRRVARADSRVAAAREQVRHLAVRLYTEGTGSLSRLLRMADANQIVRAQQYGHFLAGATTDSLHVYRAELADFGDELRTLEREQEARTDAFDELRRRRSEAITELDRLGRVAEQARTAREQERQAQARAAAAAAPVAPASPRLPTPAPTPTSPPRAAPVEAPVSRGDAAESPPPAVGADVWVCPVQGPRAFSNDYGAPRGGGASHQGNDILAPLGTPVVANVDGVVTQRTGAVSGLAYFLAGDDGSRYFGAHLDSFGASGRVSAGTVIGTVGDTGDAAGGPPHLHFEIHPGGSGYTNPYSTLTRYC